MALTNYWSCCSFLLTAGFLAVYLLIGYLIAFGFELLWLLEPTTSLPTAAMLLCAGYFCLALFCALLLHGLATKNNTCLVAWMFAVTVLTFPEAGLVIYMSIQYWRIESLYGITELACWLARIIANLIQLVLVHLLYSTWKEEELVAKRLQDLSLTAVTIPREHGLANSPLRQNNGYDNAGVDPVDINSSVLNARMWSGAVLNNMAAPNTSNITHTLYPYPLSLDAYHYVYMTQSEFNASIFLPNAQIDIGNMGKKSQSLMDLRSVHMLQELHDDKKPSQQWQTDEQNANNKPFPNYSLSLDRQRHSAKMPKFASTEALNLHSDPITTNNTSLIRNRSGLYAQPLSDYGVPIYYGPLDGPDFLIYKKQIDKLTSKNSLSNVSTDDVQKYRDVEL